MVENPKSEHDSSKKIPLAATSLGQLHDTQKQARIERVKADSDFQYDRWKVTIEYGRRVIFDDIFDFLANLPSLHLTFASGGEVESWLWQEIESVPVERQFSDRPEVVRLLRQHAGTDALIVDGWRLTSRSGRIDGETTWSDSTIVIGTNHYFAFIQLYMELIH